MQDIRIRTDEETFIVSGAMPFYGMNCNRAYILTASGSSIHMMQLALDATDQRS